MINILAKLSTFQPEKSEFDQWARGIAWNVIREYLRKTKLYFALFTEYHPNVHDYPSHEHSPEQCARRNQARCAIENAADGISSKQAIVLVLHAVDDMTHKDIGHKLKISESASQKCYQRALDHLALCISSEAFSVMPPSLASCNDPSCCPGFLSSIHKHVTTAWPTGSRSSMLESVGIEASDGAVCPGIYAAGDVVAGKRRTMLDAVAAGLRAGRMV